MIESTGQLVLWTLLALAACAALAWHIRSLPFPAGAQIAALGAAAALAVAAGFGVLFLVLVAGSCDDAGHVQAGVWSSAAAVYLLIAAWGLQRPLRAVWAVPLGLACAGAWLVMLATLLTGSTGACLG